VSQKDWLQAAGAAGNLSELYLAFGEISQALASACLSVDFADRSGDWIEQFAMRTALADALHQSGELTEAHKLFHEAEAIQEQRSPEYPHLYFVQGFHFCDLLLTREQYQEVQERAHQTIKIAKENHQLLDTALDKLSLGRAFLLQALSGCLELPDSMSSARDFLNDAVAGLRVAGEQEFIARGLLARAAFYRTQNEFAPAWADLEEAREIVERGEMKLFLADYHLEACRLCLAQHAAVETSRRDVSTTVVPTTDHLSHARQHLAIAKEMIEKMGYGRRKAEVEELQREIEKL